MWADRRRTLHFRSSIRQGSAAHCQRDRSETLRAAWVVWTYAVSVVRVLAVVNFGGVIVSLDDKLLGAHCDDVTVVARIRVYRVLMTQHTL